MLQKRAPHWLIAVRPQLKPTAAKTKAAFDDRQRGRDGSRAPQRSRATDARLSPQKPKTAKAQCRKCRAPLRLRDGDACLFPLTTRAAFAEHTRYRALRTSSAGRVRTSKTSALHAGEATIEAERRGDCAPHSMSTSDTKRFPSRALQRLDHLRSQRGIR